jgi:hypothetical protein
MRHNGPQEVQRCDCVGGGRCKDRLSFNGRLISASRWTPCASTFASVWSLWGGCHLICVLIGGIILCVSTPWVSQPTPWGDYHRPPGVVTSASKSDCVVPPASAACTCSNSVALMLASAFSARSCAVRLVSFLMAGGMPLMGCLVMVWCPRASVRSLTVMARL